MPKEREESDGENEEGGEDEQGPRHPPEHRRAHTTVLLTTC